MNRAYAPRLSTLQLLVAIRACPEVVSADLIPGRRRTAFVSARPARIAVRLVEGATPFLLTLSDAKAIYGKGVR